MSDKINIVILAAGKGTRLKMNVPKPLCKVLGRSLVDYVVDSLDSFSQEIKLELNYNFVVGHKKELVEEHLKTEFENLNFEFTHQKEQLGTGHAVQTFFEQNPKAFENKYTYVVCADTPLLTKNTFKALYNEISGYDAVAATFRAENPFGYGRIEKGHLGFNIIEQKDATPEQTCITEVNSGVYIFKTQHLKNHITNLESNNKSNEFYLTDMFKKGFNVKALNFDSETEFLGVNDLVQVETVENYLLKSKITELQKSGVRIVRSDTVYIDQKVQVEPGVVIYPNVAIYGKSKIGAKSILENGSIIKDTTIGEEVIVKAYSYFEKALVKNKSQIGPMARLREGSEVSEECKIGNFVETKKALLAKGVKISHLSYVGDAEVGENTNIGCGFITCNYDGAQKHKTIIGKNSFIGSDCQTIAPVSIGNEAYIGSGSTINKDVPDHAFAIARQRQVTKENMAKQFKKDK